jgi:phosphohistidine phosphatase SixA
VAYKTDVVEYSANDDTASKYASLSLVPRHCFLLVAALAAIATARADALYGQNLLAALRAGGFVILMRHASSPLTAPDAAIADPDNVQHERQLDDSGRTAALAFGESLRRLHIPIGQVLSSPTYRALETVKLARLGQAKTFPQLGDSGQSMLADQSGVRAAWLRAKIAEPPGSGKNTIIVTHLPNILEVFPGGAPGLADGEALILRSEGQRQLGVVARMKISDWTQLDAQH